MGAIPFHQLRTTLSAQWYGVRSRTQADAGSILPLAMLLAHSRLTSGEDAQVSLLQVERELDCFCCATKCNCNAHQVCSFVGLSWFSCQCFLQGLVVKVLVLYLGFNSKHSPSHETTKAENWRRFDPGRLGGSSYYGKEGLLPVSDECWMVCIKIRDAHVQNALSLMFPEIPE